MKLALTYDDGPNPAATPQLLDVLDKRGVKAAFFVVGKWVEAYPSFVRAMYDGGHEIGNHTFTHPKLTEIDLPEIREELVRCNVAIKKTLYSRFYVKFFRPPYILHSPAIDRLAKDEFALQTVLFHAAAGDGAGFEQGPSTDAIFQKVTEEVSRVKDLAVILMHDGFHQQSLANRDSTVEVTDRLITHYRSLGAEFIPLEHCICRLNSTT